jgi:DNA-binding NtrC family response regulator
VIEVNLPPLAERTTTSCRWPSSSSPAAPSSPTPRAKRCCAHPWPGNVRELKNAIERAALLASGQPIDVESLNLPPARAACRAQSRRAQPRVGRVRAGGRARRRQPRRAGLGLSRQALYRRMERYGLAV